MVRLKEIGVSTPAEQNRGVLRLRACYRTLLLFLCVSGVAVPPAYPQAQTGRPASGEDPSQGVGVIVVKVHGAGGGALGSLATIKVYTQRRQLYSSGTAGDASARFEGVPLGTYIVEASAPGYTPAQEQVELMMRNDQQQVSLLLRPAADPPGKPVAPGPPILAPKVQKELAKGLEALREKRTEEARKHLKNAQRLAPSSPDVNYLLGVLAMQTGDPAAARGFWEKAIASYPNHVFSLIALGEAHFSGGDAAGAKELLTRAVTADPATWRAHELLAHLFLREGTFAESEKHARRALETGKEEASDIRLVLAKSLAGQGKLEEASRALETFLKGNPPEAQAAAARRLLEGLKNAKAGKSATRADATGTEIVAAPAPAPLPPARKWLPPDVDARVPPTDSTVACNLSEILPEIQKNVVNFTRSLDRFTATETLVHQVIGDKGIAIREETRTYNYLVAFQEIRPGVLNVDEYRNGTMGFDVFPGSLATKGLPSVILVFHPAHADDFEMTCEGLSQWRGVPTWQIHFRQKEDRVGFLRTYRLNGILHAVALRGRAWISAETLQVVRLETDLRAPLPDIKLLAEHQAIDYGPVPFPSRHTELWLPAETDFYVDFRGKRIHRRLNYTNYVLFSVEERQTIQTPSAPE